MSFTFPVGALLNKSVGTKETFEVDAPLLGAQVTATLRLLKLPHEISAELQNLQTSGRARCNRCLCDFEFKIAIPSVEREFVVDLPERDIDPGEAVFYIDRGRSRIDIEDMVREEVLLHFPHIPVCFEGCKGLCDKCGIDLNKNTCSCPRESEVRISPFKFI